MHIFAQSTRQVAFWGPSRKGDALTTKDLLRIARDMRFASYNAGEWVLRKGMLNDDFYIVAYGTLEVRAPSTTQHTPARPQRAQQAPTRPNTRAGLSRVTAGVT